jgi:Flp pilus assembly protein TadG
MRPWVQRNGGAPCRPRRHLWRDRSGAPALEFALVAPTILLLIMGGVEFGRVMWTESALQMSVQQAARCYAWGVAPCTSAGAVPAYAASVAPQLNFPSTVFKVTSTATCATQVTASYKFQFIAKGLFPPPLDPTLTANACFANAVPAS